MVIFVKKEVREFLKQIGAKGGKAAKGEAKVRGDSSYYSRIGKISARSKKKRK